MDHENADARANWLNVQTSEQNFGLLAFESLNVEYQDGDIKNYKKENKLSNGLYVKEDESYLYIMLQNFNFGKEKKYIPIDTITNQGIKQYKNLKFDQEVDFVLEIDGKNNTRLLVDSYYDKFYYDYAIYSNILKIDAKLPTKGTAFNKINLMTDRTMYFPETNVHTAAQYMETGLLTYGNTNPKSSNYNSLADFYYSNGNLEIRIPWDLLNFTDPSSNEIVGDLYKSNEKKKIKSIKIGNTVKTETEFSDYKLKTWNKLEYNTRLKKSYYISKDTYKGVEN